MNKSLTSIDSLTPIMEGVDFKEVLSFYLHLQMRTLRHRVSEILPKSVIV